MDQKTFDELRGLVYQWSGISLSDRKVALLTARVAKRLRVLDLDNSKEYLEYVRQDRNHEEIVHLLDAVSTNVTSFFREPDQLDMFQDIVQKWISAGQTRFRFWSAACSTGEEPYSMIMAAFRCERAALTDIKLLATDLNTEVLQAGRDGLYQKKKLGSLPQDLAQKWFCRENYNGEIFFRIAESIQQAVVFRRLNLSRPPFPMKGPLDVIFCRNVMIYFDNVVRKRLLAEAARLLRPGGYLFVGRTESLAGNLCDLKNVGPSVYTKS